MKEKNFNCIEHQFTIKNDDGVHHREKATKIPKLQARQKYLSVLHDSSYGPQIIDNHGRQKTISKLANNNMERFKIDIRQNLKYLKMHSST